MQKHQAAFVIIGTVLIAILFSIFYWSKGLSRNQANAPKTENTDYNPTIDPTHFTSQVTNKYFTLKPGTTFTYEEKTDEGLERIEVAVTDKTKTVMGITTTVIWDRVWLNDELIEETYDWYAQNKDGNVWYFGEDVDNYENGKLKDHKGAWEAGVDGAKPGIIMKGNPKTDDSYRQEYYKGEAEDMGDVVALSKTVTVRDKTFANCLQTRDWSKIDATLNEYKYYCPDVGFVVMEETVSGGKGKVELVSVSSK